MVLGDITVWEHRRNHVRPWRDDVRFCEAIQGRTRGGERRDVIVIPVFGREIVRERSNCNHVRVVARYPD